MLVKRLFLVLLCSLHIPLIYGQYLGKLNIQEFKKAHDFGIPGVYSMFEDVTGVLWFGSTNGIYRYDGTNILEFKGNDKKILGKTNYSFLQEKNGDILIGSDYGVCRYKILTGGVELLIHVERPFDDRNKYCLIGYDRQNYLWLSIAGMGIARFKYKLELIKDRETQGGAKPDRLKYGFVDPDENLVYLGSNISSPVCIDPKDLSIKRLTMPSLSFIGKIGRRLFFISNDEIITWEGNPEARTENVYKVPSEMKTKMRALYSKVTLHDDSCLWISGMDGIMVFNHHQNRFTDFFGFEDDSRCQSLKLISELFTDKFGNTWICSETDGIKFFNNFAQGRFQFSNGNQNMNMTVMDLEPVNDSLVLVCPLVNTPCLINIKNNTTQQLFSKNPEPAQTFKLDRLNDSLCLLSSLGATAYLFNYRTHNIRPVYCSPNKTPFVKVIVSKKNEGYLLSYSEIFKFKFDGKSIVLSRGLPVGGVFNFTLLHDPLLHQLVFSTREKSLVIDDSDLRIKKDSLPVFGAFNGYAFDKNHELWLATRLGLKHFGKNYQLLKTYSTDQGLANDVIYALSFNKDSTRLFLSTNMGISELDLKNKTFSNYTMQNGLQESEHNSGAVAWDSHGRYFFGNIRGITFFSEFRLSAKSKAPDIVVFSLLVNDSAYRKNIQPQFIDSISLRPNAANLSLRYSLINSSEAEKIVYSYKLEGISNSWETSLDAPLINYPQLEPGDYTLILRGCVNDTCSEKRIRIIVLPPFYATWWFITMSVISGVLLFFLFVSLIAKARVRNREKKLETERRLLEQKNQISRDLHDNVGARLSMMLNTIDWMNKTETFKPDIVAELQDSTQSVIQNLRETIWVMNKEEITATELFDKIKTYALQFFKHVDTHVGFFENFPVDAQINSEHTLHLFRITQEVLNNVLKYAHAKQVNITLQHDAEGRFELCFEDNGRGFDPEQYQPGNGLLNMKERAGKMKAEFDLTTAPGKGTSVTIIFYSK